MLYIVFRWFFCTNPGWLNWAYKVGGRLSFDVDASRFLQVDLHVDACRFLFEIKKKHLNFFFRSLDFFR